MCEEGKRRPIDVSKGHRPSPKAKKRQDIDPCDLDRLDELIDHRAWFILRVKPGAEFSVVRLLGDRRLFAFTPTRIEHRFSCKFAKKKTAFRFASAPGYVVVAQDLDHARRRWANVMACEGVVDILDFDQVGYPLQICVRDVELIAGISTKADQVERFMRTHGEFVRGDMVRVADGPFEGREGEAISIRDAQTTVTLKVLGAVRPVVIDTRLLERVA